jgi:predicted transcriptional regulator
MERIKDTSTVKILLALYNEGELYTEQLARKAGLSLRHTKRVLPVMVEEGIIEQYQQKNKNYYKLTDKGMALAWGLSNPDALADLYRKRKP